jgi:hypothetical protein
MRYLIWLWRSLMTRLQCAWQFIKDILFALLPARFSFIVLAIGFVLLAFIPQSQDVLIAFAEDKDIDNPSWLWFFLAVGWWAVNTWYWARSGFAFAPNSLGPGWCPTATEADRQRRDSCLVAHIPRVLGALVFLVVGFALYKASRVVIPTEGEQIQAIRRLKEVAIISVGLSIAFYLAVAFRRQAIRAMGVTRVPEAPLRQNLNVLTLPRGMKVTVGALFSVNFAIFLAATIDPVSTGRWFGAGDLFMLAAGAWVAAGTLIVILSHSVHLPLLGAIVVIALLTSFAADNHSIRIVDKDGGSIEAQRILAARPFLARAYDAWYAQAQGMQDNDGAIPMVVVATAGGGIRAAYWTGTVLGELTDHHLKFRKQLFAISGVSGGSLGATAYRALLTEFNDQTPRCHSRPDGREVSSYRECLQALFSEDFIGPLFAGFLYPDLVQRFVPVAFLPDRARALEESWEDAWRKVVGSDRFERAFDTLWLPDPTTAPHLFLNGTSVETGKRIITSNVRLDRDGPVPSDDPAWKIAVFADASDFFSLMPTQIRVSTAANNSSRFTYFEPAGTLKKNGEPTAHLVDGGYFENFGAGTARDLLQEVLKIAQSKGHKLQINLVQISSDPDLLDEWPDSCRKGPRPPDELLGALREILAPLVALFQTREARGTYAAADLDRFMKDNALRDGGVLGEYFHLRMSAETGVAGAPLGWTLSDWSRLRIAEQWEHCYGENGGDPITAARIEAAFPKQNQ